ncbi:MAG TPA: electron transport complex subunit E [Gammaproteobacteria bacterium]|nr:electron transport complex subunit E [Gammaproteobacteria bacterium]
MTGSLWRENPALVHVLGICPLLAVTTSVVNGLALGLATTAVIVATNTLVSMTRRWLVPALRILVFVLIIAAFVSIVDLLSNAYFHDLHEILGLFVPLIVTNCVILAQAETTASRRPVLPSMLVGLSTGLGFTGVLVALGALRELLGRGTLLAGFDLLIGSTVTIEPLVLPVRGLLVLALPPGAFFGLAVLIAAKNHIDARRRAPTGGSRESAVTESPSGAP